MFELLRVNFIATGLPFAEPITGKKRFFAPECDLSLKLCFCGRGAAWSTADVCRPTWNSAGRGAVARPHTLRALSSQGSIVEDGT